MSYGYGYGSRFWRSRRGASGPRIVITASSILESAVSGSTVGVLSVVGGEGTYTFTKTADPDSKFALAGTNNANLNTAAALDYETATSHSVTISASNGVDDPIVRVFTIGVLDVDENPPLDFAGMGQSNFLFWITNTSGRPAAHPDTFVWDPDTSAWVEPAGNGVRTFLNAMQAATGRVCRMVYGGQSGVPIALLQKGAANGNYEALLARIIASGSDPQYMIWHQGEGDANTASPTISGYRTALDTFHGSITSDLSKTRAQLPIVLSSLANVDSAVATSFNQPDSSWQTIQQALAGINADYPNIHYSHSNRDAVLTDGVHWDGPSYGRSGARSARTVQVLMGLETARPRLFWTSAERVSETETRVNLAHSMGADFTPASGITGAEFSNDGGGTWVSATGAREDEDSVIFTHTGLGTNERRFHYQYGKLPDVTGALKDDGALAAPINFTTSDIVAAGSVTLPVLSYAGTLSSANANTTQTIAGFAVDGSSNALLCLMGVAVQGVAPSGCTAIAQPSGTRVTATLVAVTTLRPRLALYQAELPSGTTSVDVELTFGATPFANAVVHVATGIAANFNSTTAVSSGNNRLASASAISTTLPTSDGGVVFALASFRNVAATAGSISGDETYSADYFFNVSGSSHTSGRASGTAASASSTVTATYTGTANEISILAASYR
jgi:hypothetical protein